MKKTNLLIVCLWLLLPAVTFGQNHGERFKIGDRTLEITFYKPSVVRVRVAASDSFSTRKSLSIVASPQAIPIKKIFTADSAVLASVSLSVTVSMRDGSIRFSDHTGAVILQTTEIDASSLIERTVADERVYFILQGFLLSPGEALYGLGQFEDPIMNYRGHTVHLTQANRTAVNPFLLSTKGYGILWDNYSNTRFADKNGTGFFSSEVADNIDYYVCTGPSMDSVVARYRFLTGSAPMFGKWAYGYWQSKERYTSATELLGVLDDYRARRIPMDNLVQDWNYWPSPEQFSAMVWDSARYPSPKRMIDSIHVKHAHIIASIWPAFGTGSELYRDMKAHGFLYTVPHWNGGLVYDAYNPDARDLYWKYIRNGMFDVGLDGFWTDGTEPEFRCTDDQYVTELSMRQAGRNYLGTFARYLNTYSLMTNGGIYTNWRATTGKKRVFQLTRSAFAGQQRCGAATWSGDTFATWDDLKIQIAAGTNFSMSGIPYWNSDIGGFITSYHFPKGSDDPAYRELYVRWFQFGAFSPIFRAHGTNIAREIWRFGSKGDWAFDALVVADRLRYRLMPYIYSVASMVTHSGYSFMRGLAMGAPADTNTYNVADQYFFGPSILVHPITRPLKYEPEIGGIDITPEHFHSPDGEEHGSDLTIYRGLSFDKPALQRKIDVGQIAWYGCIPLDVDSAYSISIKGQLKTDTSGIHTFYIRSDGGVRFRLNDSLLIDTWDNREDRVFTATYPLSSSVGCTFMIEHRQFKPQTANFKMNWRKPDAPSIADQKIETYLPAGSKWYDFWTGRMYNGGVWIESSTKIEEIPLYVPAGSIVPVGPDIQYAMERTRAPIELRIYTGKDAQFTLYDDEGDSYNYEKGVCSRIPIHWHEKNKTLTIGDQAGTFPGAPEEITFNVVLVRKGRGAGLESTSRPDSTLVYRRKELKIKL